MQEINKIIELEDEEDAQILQDDVSGVNKDAYAADNLARDDDNDGDKLRMENGLYIAEVWSVTSIMCRVKG